MIVQILVCDSAVAPDRNLWVVVPDTWPDGLKIVWLVRGDPDSMRSTTIPIEATEILAIAETLFRLLP